MLVEEYTVSVQVLTGSMKLRHEARARWTGSMKLGLGGLLGASTDRLYEAQAR